MDGFMSVSNLKLCESVFKSYMRDRHSVIISSSKDCDNARKILFKVMDDVHRRKNTGELDRDSSVKELNNITLNAARDIFMRSTSTQVREGGNVVQITADGNGTLPARTNVVKSFETINATRKAETEPRAPPRAFDQPESDHALDATEFKSRLADLEVERNKQLQVSKDLLPPPIVDVDPTAFYKATPTNADDHSFSLTDSIASALYPTTIPASHLLDSQIGPKQSQTIVERYLALHGGDRSVTMDPYRFRFTVSVLGADVNDLQDSYRNIQWIESTCLVIPREIQPSSSTNRSFYQYGNNFSYPYLLLNIDGMDGVYDGTNDALRRAFCVFIYKRSYQSPNGRGYVVLEPMQCEKKSFAPSPLSSLRNLRISVLRPNGTLFNNSVDRFSVSSLEYDPSDRLYMRIIMDRYADANEFSIGDTIRINDFALSPAPGDPDPDAFPALAQFINRQEGHEIVSLAELNADGFLRSIYILAPGILDQGAGTVIIDTRITRAIQQMASATNTAVVQRTGTLINTSLQCVVSLKVGQLTTQHTV